MASDLASHSNRRDADSVSKLRAKGLQRSLLRFVATGLAVASIFAGLNVACQAYVLSEKRINLHGITFVLKEFNWNGKDGSVLQASRKGKQLLEKRGHRFFFYFFDREEQPFELDSKTKIPTADFNGDGVQDVIIEEWTGGAHCCYTFEIYSLDRSLTRLWHHDSGHGHLKVETNKGHLPALSVEDSTFAYWGPFGFADSPRPSVALIWRDGTYHIDRVRMRQPFDRKTFERVRKEPSSADAARFFIQEVYKGNASQALNLWSALGPKDSQEYFSSFLKQFRTSPFYYQLVHLNGSRCIGEMQRIAKAK